MSMTVTAGMGAMIPQNMEQGITLSGLMAKSKLVPAHLQGKPEDCFLIIEQAARWRMSPFAVAQCTSLVSGRLNFEGKLVAAALHTSGALSSRLSYAYAGAGDNRTVTVSAMLAGEAEPRSMSVRLGDVKTSNAFWVKQPDQQLAYSGARNWARRYAPEVMLGVYSNEEFDAPVAAAETFAGTTIDAGPVKQSTAEYLHDEIPEKAQPKRTVREIVRDKLVGCYTNEEIVAVADLPQVRKALAEAPDAVRAELAGMIDGAYARVRDGVIENATDADLAGAA